MTLPYQPGNPLADRELDGEEEAYEPIQLTNAEAAKACGLSPSAWRGAVTRGQAPKPTDHFPCGCPWWDSRVIDEESARRVAMRALRVEQAQAAASRAAERALKTKTRSDG